MERDFFKYNTYLCKSLLHVMSRRKKIRTTVVIFSELNRECM